MNDFLEYTDWGIFAAGVAILVAGLIRVWKRRPRPGRSPVVAPLPIPESTDVATQQETALDDPAVTVDAGQLIAWAPRKNSVRVDALALTVLVYVAATYAAMQLAWKLAGGNFNLAANALAGSAGQVAGIAACVWVGATQFDGGLRTFLRGRTGVARAVVRGVLVLFGATPIVAGLYLGSLLSLQWLFPQRTFAVQSVIIALRDGSLPAWMLGCLVLGAVVVAPLAEEMFFRGLVQTLMLNVTASRWKSIVMGGILFGAVHYSYGHPHVIVPLAALGIALGLVYEMTGSLCGPIAMHALFNAKTLLWEYLRLSQSS